MTSKKTYYAEAAYLTGLLFLALGTALMERANFGMSMVVAPAYIFHLKLSQFFPWFSFGMAEYCLQALLLVILACAMRRFKISYLFSFVTAVIYGFMLDLMMAGVALLPPPHIPGRIVCFVIGLLLCSVGIAFLFNTYIAPEAYELLVKEIAGTYQKPITKVKTIYDCTSCLIAVILSFIFFGFGHFEGVKWGTILCALINGWIIGRCSVILEKYFRFKRAFPLRDRK